MPNSGYLNSRCISYKNQDKIKSHGSMTTLEKYHQQRVVTDKNRRTHYRVAKCPKSITVRLTTELNEHLLIKLYVMNFTKINVVSMVSVQRYITWCKHNSCSQISQKKKINHVSLYLDRCMLEEAKRCFQHTMSVANFQVQWEIHNGMDSHVMEIIRSSECFS